MKADLDNVRIVTQTFQLELHSKRTMLFHSLALHRVVNTKCLRNLWFFFLHLHLNKKKFVIVFNTIILD